MTEKMTGVVFRCRTCRTILLGTFSFCSVCRSTVSGEAVPTDCPDCLQPRHLDKDTKACCPFCDHNQEVLSGHNGFVHDHIKEADHNLPSGFRHDLKGHSVFECDNCNFQDTRPLNADRHDWICRLCGHDNRSWPGAPKTERMKSSMVNPIAFANGNCCPACGTIWHQREGQNWCDSCERTEATIMQNLGDNIGMWGFTDDGKSPCNHLIALRQTIEALDLSLVGSIASHATNGKVMVWCHQCRKRYAVQLAHPFMDANNKATCHCSACQGMKNNG